MKILVVIANYGTKNDKFLKSLISEYQGMDFQVQITLLSNQLKNFGDGINTVVGLPEKNPWSLPFGYKPIFAENINHYDLFIYSEDDTLVKENNIQSFLKVTNILPKDEIAGFIRYEKYEDGEKFYTSIHSHYHWDPRSVKMINGYTFAYYSNEHAACFILTKDQLKRAIESNSFMNGPREGRYDMLCTAATDPYTQCGFRKMICISHIDDFSLNHLPSVYRGKMGISAKMLDLQIERLKEIEKGVYPRSKLFETTTKHTVWEWDKQYYESTRLDLLNKLPMKFKNILSVGCGWGSTEEVLSKKGAVVTAIPLDSVMAACAEERGIKTTLPDFEAAQKELKGRRFDCILFFNVLEYQEHPENILGSFVEFLEPKGFIAIAYHNLFKIDILKKRYLQRRMYSDLKYLGHYHKSGIQRLSYKLIHRWLKRLGFIDIYAEPILDNKFAQHFGRAPESIKFPISSQILVLAQK